MRKQGLLSGTLVLFSSNFINRILGFIYQISIVNLIGAQGIGLFNMVYPLYILVLVISSLGLPIAIAKSVAEYNRKPELSFLVLKKSIVILTLFSVFVTLISIFSLDWISPLFITNQSALPILKILLLAVPIVTICSGFRGFFQGLMLMNAPALSQFLEQLIRVTFGLFLASYLISKGEVWGAIGSSLGLVAGETAGFILLFIFFIKWLHINRIIANKKSYSQQNISAKQLLMFALPIALGKIIATLLLSFEAILIPRQLVNAGMSLSEATELYGQLSGMALPILVIPSVFTNALATTLVPAIAEVSRQPNLLQERIRKSMFYTFLIGLPATVIFFLFAQQICYILFKQFRAGEALRILSFGGLFYYLQQTTTGILQGLNQPKKPLENMLWGSIIEIIFLLVFVPSSSTPFMYSCWAINISFIITSIINIIDIIKYAGFKSVYDKKIFLMLPGAAIMGSIAFFVFNLFFHILNNLSITLILTLIISFFVYFIFLTIFKIISFNGIVTLTSHFLYFLKK